MNGRLREKGHDRLKEKGHNRLEGKGTQQTGRKNRRESRDEHWCRRTDGGRKGRVSVQATWYVNKQHFTTNKIKFSRSLLDQTPPLTCTRVVALMVIGPCGEGRHTHPDLHPPGLDQEEGGRHYNTQLEIQ
ncbi:hypothetical protein Pmani_039281 [Petrolisthes manimaculis]|uniref:Uncharacterized protein n=1 Tax=Petrolisthes manimaculis TaxID=1843537 RepID=A0AAE1NE01_9EUCA|nr:hypothetical protein Pmani_039281 [Petrolisthes manimaculis]